MFKDGDVIRIGVGVPLKDYEGLVLRVVGGDAIEIGGRLSGQFKVINGVGMVLDGEVGPWTFNQAWQAAITKIGEGDLYVGQRVVLRDDAPYQLGRNNPRGVVGTIIGLKQGMPLVVLWDNGEENSYYYQDLDLIVRAGPKPAKKKAAPKKKKKKSPTLLDQLSEAVKLLNGSGSNPTAKYVDIYKGSKPTINGNTACHAGLNADNVGCRLVVSCIRRGIKDHPWFYKWLIDESPWSSAFYRRYAWSRKNEVVVVRTDISSTFMFGALFATRIWEDHVNVDFVKKFKKHFPIEFLYPICCQYNFHDGRHSFTRKAGGHFPFDHMPEKVAVKNFIKGSVKKTSKTFAECGCRDGQVSGVFGGTGGSDDFIPKAWGGFGGLDVEKGRFGGSLRSTKSEEVVIKFLQSIYEKVKA